MSYNFVARQPIFTKKQKLFAYELLFRDGPQATEYKALDGASATIQVLENSLLNIGIKKLTNGHPAFVNFPTEILMAPFIMDLPADTIIIEILETVIPTVEIIEQCKKLKAAGFHLALDDVVPSSSNMALLPFIDYLKVDFRLTNRKERRDIIKQFNRPELVFVAEKVETYTEFEEAVHDGYSLLQGYFFSRPEVLNNKSVQIVKQTVVLFMQELMVAEVDYKKLEDILRHDSALSYKIMRFINSPYFGFQTKINSIRQALTLLGQKELYKWSALFVLSNFAINKPAELLILSLVRARFAELISIRLGQKNKTEFFLLGMFSLMDAYLDQSMNEIVGSLPVSDEVKQSMLGERSIMGTVLALITSYERADWADGSMLAETLNLSEYQLAEDYYHAQLWSGIETINAFI